MKKLRSPKIDREYWIEERAGEFAESCNSTRQFLYKDHPQFHFYEAEVLKRVAKTLSNEDLNALFDRRLNGESVFDILRGRDFTPSIKAAISHYEKQDELHRMEKTDNEYLRDIYRMLRGMGR